MPTNNPNRIVYPATRKMYMPKSETKDVPFFYHHDHDRRHWVRQGGALSQ